MATASAQEKQQDKQEEIAFFDAHAAADEYDVFTPQASARLIDAFVSLSGLKPGGRVADLGCGSGAFTHLLKHAGYDCVGLDISPNWSSSAAANIRTSSSSKATSSGCRFRMEASTEFC